MPNLSIFSEKFVYPIANTQSNLDGGKGLPVVINVLYIVLGSMVSLKKYEAILKFKI
jgi:hypothetical protein